MVSTMPTISRSCRVGSRCFLLQKPQYSPVLRGKSKRILYICSLLAWPIPKSYRNITLLRQCRFDAYHQLRWTSSERNDGKAHHQATEPGSNGDWCAAFHKDLSSDKEKAESEDYICEVDDHLYCLCAERIHEGLAVEMENYLIIDKKPWQVVPFKVAPKQPAPLNEIVDWFTFHPSHWTTICKSPHLKENRVSNFDQYLKNFL